MKKKLLFFIIAKLLPIMVSADAVEIDGIYYNLVSKIKTVEVTGTPQKNKGVVAIPVTRRLSPTLSTTYRDRR